MRHFLLTVLTCLGSAAAAQDLGLPSFDPDDIDIVNVFNRDQLLVRSNDRFFVCSAAPRAGYLVIDYCAPFLNTEEGSEVAAKLAALEKEEADRLAALDKEEARRIAWEEAKVAGAAAVHEAALAAAAAAIETKRAELEPQARVASAKIIELSDSRFDEMLREAFKVAGCKQNIENIDMVSDEPLSDFVNALGMETELVPYTPPELVEEIKGGIDRLYFAGEVIYRNNRSIAELKDCA